MLNLLMSFLEDFFLLKTGSGAVLWANIVNPKRHQFSLKLYGPSWAWAPVSPAKVFPSLVLTLVQETHLSSKGEQK